MKYSVLAFALGVAATEFPTVVLRDSVSHVERDLATVTGVVNDVGTKITALDTAVQGFSGDVGPLTSASTDLSDTIKSGTTTIQGTDALTLNDALSLQTIVQGLQSNGDKLVQDLAAKKSAFEQAGLCSVVLQQSTDLSTNSKALIDAVVSKVPTEAQTIASQLASGFTATLAQSQATFAEGNCTNASGSGGGSGSSSSAAGGATTTAAATTSASGGGSGSNATATKTSATAATSTPATFTGAAQALIAPIGAALGLAAMML